MKGRRGHGAVTVNEMFLRHGKVIIRFAYPGKETPAGSGVTGVVVLLGVTRTWMQLHEGIKDVNACFKSMRFVLRCTSYKVECRGQDPHHLCRVVGISI